jgi:hypothetical protein
MKIMFKRLLISALALSPLLGAAQVGVGTTSVHSSAKLQIESANKGFLQPRVTLTGTGDNTTVASPATGLMVFNTATAGSGSTAVTPGVYYYSGSAWTRLSDATPTTFVAGTWGGGTGGGLAVIAPDGPPTYPLATITLPPGKWEVVLNIMNLVTQSAAIGDPIPAGCSMWMTYWIADGSPSAAVGSWTFPQTLPDITSDVVVGGSASYVEVMNGLHKGSFLINNTSGSNKTYELHATESTECSPSGNDGYSSYFNALGSSSYPQNRFYAVSIN